MAAKSDLVEAGTLTFWLKPDVSAPTRPTSNTICLGTATAWNSEGETESHIFVPLSNGAGYTGHQSIHFGATAELDANAPSGANATEVANDGTTTSNGTAISFGPSSAAWNSSSPITHFGVYGNISGSNVLLYWGTLDNQRTVAAGGETITINNGALKIRES